MTPFQRDQVSKRTIPLHPLLHPTDVGAVFSIRVYNTNKVVICMLNNEIKEQIIEKLKRELNPSFIMLFGSFVKGTVHEESDVDLAYFSNKQLSSYERFLLAGELALICKREVDLVDIKQIDTVFTMQIFEQGTPIYIQDENEYTRQKMRAYSMYTALNEQRAPIIEAIKERGSVFGHE